jgi:signal transduction histidine kinase
MVKNALEASRPGDTVTIGCAKENDNAVFRVHNTGSVPADVGGRIFKRFFSTKGDGRGLGTYSMKLLAESYLGGKVWFTSDDEKGTDFYVSIPLELDDGGE